MSRARAPAVALLTLSLLVLLAASAAADWDPTRPAKWVQLPDLTPTGIDVDCSPPRGDYILADDFPCNETGRITGIHLWGSWYHDMITDPTAVTFVLSIHADIPNGPDGYSIPGEVLWTHTFQPGTYTARIWQEGLQEGWLDPPEPYEYPGDTVCWQYNFTIPPEEAFLQEGTPDSAVVYWLDVKAFPQDPGTFFGWKTTQDHWNDDAVWGQGQEPYPGPWFELRYPPGHELVGESMDLAFVIESVPEQQTYKWEQPPDLATTGMDVHATYQSPNGGYILADDFQCTEDGLITGIRVWGSWQNDFGPTDPSAVTFTLSIHADVPVGPDGYSIPGDVLWMRTFSPGTYTGGVWQSGLQEGWLTPPDQYVFPGDTVCWYYDFTIPTAEAFHQVGSPEQPMVYWLDVQVKDIPFDAVWGWKTARTHWNDDAVWGNGEDPYPGPWYELRYPPGHDLVGQSVDLAFALTGQPVQESLDWGDAPDAVGAVGYPTLAVHNGASHVIVPGFYLGGGVDAETDGQPDANATGDDNDGNDDEDGVLLPPTLRPGQTFTLSIQASAAGFVDAWIDYDNNRSWLDPGEQILAAAPVSAGLNNFSFTVPAGTATNVTSFARFRFSSVGGLSPGGPAPDGEVEDYAVDLGDQYNLKWDQEPDLSSEGIDVALCPDPSGVDYILADDFLCTTTGPLTDFRIWTSWLGDYLPFQGDPTAVSFIVSIHADIPDSLNPDGYSMPGDVLWWHHFNPGEFRVSRFAEGWEGWLDPPDQYLPQADSQCLYYWFHVDPHLAFQQEGTPEQPVVYWLDVKAFPQDPEARIGWKTARTHWNDDAVWGAGLEPYAGPWYELRYPPQHPDSLQSIDLAFQIFEDTITEVPDGRTPPRLNLRQNAPNPFNPRTEIAYDLPEGGTVRLAVYDAAGRRVRVLVDGPQSAGPHAVTWDGKDDAGRAVPAGVYFARLRTAHGRETVKMSLVR